MCLSNTENIISDWISVWDLTISQDLEIADPWSSPQCMRCFASQIQESCALLYCCKVDFNFALHRFCLLSRNATTEWKNPLSWFISVTCLWWIMSFLVAKSHTRWDDDRSHCSLVIDHWFAASKFANEAWMTAQRMTFPSSVAEASCLKSSTD